MSKQTGLEEVARKLHSAALHLMRYVRAQDVAMGIGLAQSSALSVLAFGGPSSLSDLARTEQVRPPTMSRVVDALVREGLVKREVGKKDRRSVLISATDKGTRVMQEGRSGREKRLLDLLQPLHRAEVASLDEAADTILRALATSH